MDILYLELLPNFLWSFTWVIYHGIIHITAVKDAHPITIMEDKFCLFIDIDHTSVTCQTYFELRINGDDQAARNFKKSLSPEEKNEIEKVRASNSSQKKYHWETKKKKRTTKGIKDDKRIQEDKDTFIDLTIDDGQVIDLTLDSLNVTGVREDKALEALRGKL